MAVLMSYHKLVERDSQYVNYCWKCTTICLLLLSIISCLGGSLSLKKLIFAYDDHCILGADLRFKLNSTRNDTNIALTGSNSYAISEFFDSTTASRLQPFSDKNVYPENELVFIRDYIIDDKETRWGKHSGCDFSTFIPIFQFCFGIILTVMFIICGKGGNHNSNQFLPQPWRIVFPSLIFFLAMMCISIVNLTTIQSGLESFCSGFMQNASDLGCLVSMNSFALNKKITVLPSILYILLLLFSWILLICWIVLLCIMAARIIFVVDFQLVRVTIKTLNGDGSIKDGATYQVVEPHEDDKNGKQNDAV